MTFKVEPFYPFKVLFFEDMFYIFILLVNVSCLMKQLLENCLVSLRKHLLANSIFLESSWSTEVLCGQGKYVRISLTRF